MKTAAELCEGLLSCAGQHGDAEGSEVQLGDIEDFFRAAFDRLTPEQLGRFWDDPRVAGTVREIPEYEELAGEVYYRDRPSEPTVREASDFLPHTRPEADRSTDPVADDQRIPVTFTHVEQDGDKTYRAGGLYLSLGGGPGIGHVAMRSRSRRPEMGDHLLCSRGLARRPGPAARPRRLPGRLRDPDARPNLTLATKGKPDGQTPATPLLALRGAGGLLRPDQLAGHADPRRQFGRWPLDRHLREDAADFDWIALHCGRCGHEGPQEEFEIRPVARVATGS